MFCPECTIAISSLPSRHLARGFDCRRTACDSVFQIGSLTSYLAYFDVSMDAPAFAVVPITAGCAIAADGVSRASAGPATALQAEMVLPVRIELTTSALPRMRSTTELRQHFSGGGAPMTVRALRLSTRTLPRAMPLA